MTRKNESRGFLLVVAALVMVVIAVLTAVYLSTIVGEKRSVDSERLVLQALNFAEGGANQIFATLRSSIQISLGTFDNTTKNRQDNDLFAFTTNSLNVFNMTGNVTVNATCAVISLDRSAASEFDSSISGAVNATAVILPAENVQLVNGVYHFNNYTYSVSSDAVINYGNTAIKKRVTFAPAKFSLTARRTNFAKYALFTFHHRTSGGTTVWFTGDTNFYGPVHTNERFSFANNPSGHFTNEITQSQGTARFYNDGNSILLADDHNGVLDVPIFDSTFERSQDVIPLPASVSQTDLRNAALGDMAVPGTSNPGVYVPNTAGTLTGGIYINGNSGQASDNASIALSVSGANPVYTFTQRIGDSSAAAHPTHLVDVTTTVLVNYSANTTTVTVVRQTVPEHSWDAPVVLSTTTNTYTGKPDGNTHEGIIIYANDDIGYWDSHDGSDNIPGLSGTVQQDTNMTVSGERDIMITGNVEYQGCSTTPMLNAEGYGNMLGIMSWGGNVRVGVAAPPDVNINAVVMAPHGVFTVDDYDNRAACGTATLLGGVISDYYGAFGTFNGASRTGYGRRFIYDARVLSGQAPPYFPYLDKYAFDSIPGLNQKPIWKEEEISNE